jgi:hypothetical protein
MALVSNSAGITIKQIHVANATPPHTHAFEGPAPNTYKLTGQIGILRSGNVIAYMYRIPQALEFRTPLFPHLAPPAIMVWIFVWKYIFEPFIHMLQLSRSNNFSF